MNVLEFQLVHFTNGRRSKQFVGIIICGAMKKKPKEHQHQQFYYETVGSISTTALALRGDSISIVTGPSFCICTCIIAPNTPSETHQLQF